MALRFAQRGTSGGRTAQAPCQPPRAPRTNPSRPLQTLHQPLLTFGENRITEAAMKLSNQNNRYRKRNGRRLPDPMYWLLMQAPLPHMQF